jgi:hypothetical protein
MVDLSKLILWWLDRLPEWETLLEPPSERDPGECFEARCAADDLEDPNKEGVPPAEYPVVDLEAKAALAAYANGVNKRRKYSPVDLTRRRVVIVLHQMGVERSPLSSRWPLVTAHRVIGPDGTRMRLHPLRTRLVAANRVDRAPWHAISIEIAGNFEGTDGAGDWYKPQIYGRGRMGVAQVLACRQELTEIIVNEVPELGGKVEAIIPHRVTGQSKGKPNRPICPGSRAWSQVGEWTGAFHGIAVPGPSFKLGGLPVLSSWHGPFFDNCLRFL